MTRLFKTLAGTTALSSALLVGIAASSPMGAAPLLTGQGSWEVPIGTVSFEVNVVEQPDGTIQGSGVSTLKGADGSQGWFQFDVTESAEFAGGRAVAGIITSGKNLPGPWVGTLTALLVLDDGDGSGGDRATSASGLPPFLTLADILAFAPPPAAWFPLSGGNFQIH